MNISYAIHWLLLAATVILLVALIWRGRRRRTNAVDGDIDVAFSFWGDGSSCSSDAGGSCGGDGGGGGGGD